MHVYDTSGCLQEYESVEEVVKEYYKERLFYHLSWTSNVKEAKIECLKDFDALLADDCENDSLLLAIVENDDRIINNFNRSSLKCNEKKRVLPKEIGKNENKHIEIEESLMEGSELYIGDFNTEEVDDEVYTIPPTGNSEDVGYEVILNVNVTPSDGLGLETSDDSIQEIEIIEEIDGDLTVADDNDPDEDSLTSRIIENDEEKPSNNKILSNPGTKYNSIVLQKQKVNKKKQQETQKDVYKTKEITTNIDFTMEDQFIENQSIIKEDEIEEEFEGEVQPIEHKNELFEGDDEDYQIIEYFICSVADCRKVFKSRGNLRRHELIHTGDKPFTCNKCSAAFNQQINLKRHKEQVHKLEILPPEKPKKCPFCGKAYSAGASLSRHMREHKGKSFTCKICNKLNPDCDTHRRHVLTHVDDQTKSGKRKSKLSMSTTLVSI